MLLVFLVEPVLAIGDKNVSVNSGVGVINTGSGPVTITNIQGISPEEHRKIAKELGVTEIALENFFETLHQEKVPLKDLDETLREIAKHYSELLEKIKVLEVSEDPEVQKLIAQAKKVVEQQKYDEAEKLLNQASELDLASAIKAEDAAKRALEIAKKRRISAAESKAANGDLMYTQLKYSEAANYFQQAADILPEGNEETLAGYLNNAANALHYAGQYTQAQPLSEKALAIREKVLGAEHPDVATSLNNLAALYSAQGEYDKALPLHQRALAIYEKVLSAEHPEVASSLNNLAALYDSQGKYDKALPLYQRALAIYEKVLSAEHPDVATSLNNLALLYKTQGKYDKALPLY